MDGSVAARSIAALFLAFVLAGCGPKTQSKASLPPEILRAEGLAKTLTSPRHLRNSTYGVTMDSGKPAELVSFLFSDLGVAEWPDVKGVTPLVHGRPNPRLSVQLVLRGDDEKNELVAEAYTDPAKPPVYIERWPMPDVSKLKRPR